MDSARRVTGCHLSKEARVRNAFDAVASKFHRTLYYGGSGRRDGAAAGQPGGRAQIGAHYGEASGPRTPQAHADSHSLRILRVSV
jgi:hypothetical protein